MTTITIMMYVFLSTVHCCHLENQSIHFHVFGKSKLTCVTPYTYIIITHDHILISFRITGGGLLCLLLPNTTREPLSWPRLSWLHGQLSRLLSSLAYSSVSVYQWRRHLRSWPVAGHPADPSCGRREGRVHLSWVTHFSTLFLSLYLGQFAVQEL